MCDTEQIDLILVCRRALELAVNDTNNADAFTLLLFVSTSEPMRSVRPSTVGTSASPARRGYLNDVAAGVGTDLRLDGGRVVDTGSNLNDDETVPTTTAYTAPTPSEPAEPDESSFVPGSGYFG